MYTVLSQNWLLGCILSSCHSLPQVARAPTPPHHAPTPHTSTHTSHHAPTPSHHAPTPSHHVPTCKVPLLTLPSNISHEGYVQSLLQSDLSKGENVQSCLILCDSVVDKFHSVKQINHCTNNLGRDGERRGERGEGKEDKTN